MSNSSNITRKKINCIGFNPPSCSNVPGKTWNLFVSESIINNPSILNNKNTIPQSGKSTWKYSNENNNIT